MISNYHTHTTLCRHAEGTQEEMVQAAMETGLKILGFSDHTPYPFPEGYYSDMRMYPQELPEYARSLRELQEKYRGALQLHIGLEAEYYPLYFPQLRQMAKDNGIEYMILGQHWIDNEINAQRMCNPFGEEAVLEEYCNQILEAVETGAFSYVAHPDLPNFVGERKAYDRQMRRLLRELKSRDMPIEINLHGLWVKTRYPNPHFWEMAAEEGCKAILGVDAHRPAELLHKENPAQMEQMARALGLELLPQLELAAL